jgi:hypothetical protein
VSQPARSRPAGRCPRCNQPEVYPSRVRGLDFLLTLLLLRPYRCHNCSRRYWRPLLAPPAR